MKSKGRVLYFVLGFVIILVLLFLNIEKSTPGNQPFYNAKRLYEKAQLAFASTPSEKVDVLSHLLDERLKELEVVVVGGQSREVLKASSRYSTTAGQLTETSLQNNLTDKIPEVKAKLVSQQEIVRELVEKYPKQDDEKKFIVDAVNYLTIYIDQLSSENN